MYTLLIINRIDTYGTNRIDTYGTNNIHKVRRKYHPMILTVIYTGNMILTLPYTGDHQWGGCLTRFWICDRTHDSICILSWGTQTSVLQQMTPRCRTCIG